MFKLNLSLYIVLIFTFLILVPVLPKSASGDAAKVIQTQDTNVSGVVAELTECKRKEGVLTLKVRFRNTSADPARWHLYHGGQDRKNVIDKFYVTAGNKKYFVLKDTEKEPLASDECTTDLKKDGTYSWWGKFPAPPPEVKAIDLVIPEVTPFEDVPITD